MADVASPNTHLSFGSRGSVVGRFSISIFTSASPSSSAVVWESPTVFFRARLRPFGEPSLSSSSAPEGPLGPASSCSSPFGASLSSSFSLTCALLEDVRVVLSGLICTGASVSCRPSPLAPRRVERDICVRGLVRRGIVAQGRDGKGAESESKDTAPAEDPKPVASRHAKSHATRCDGIYRDRSTLDLLSTRVFPSTNTRFHNPFILLCG